MPSLQATGSSLTPCPHRYWDQQSTSIFHLFWLLFPSISQLDDYSYPAYQAPLKEGSRRWRYSGEMELAHTESPRDFIHTFYAMRALLFPRHPYCIYRECIKCKASQESLIQTVLDFQFSWHIEKLMISETKGAGVFPGVHHSITIKRENSLKSKTKQLSIKLKLMPSIFTVPASSL